MKLASSLLLVFGLEAVAVAQDSSPESFFQEYAQENLAHNLTVTDQEIVAYLEFMLKYSPGVLADFQNQAPEERAEYLTEYRRVHNEAMIGIPTLRGRDEEELAVLDSIARMHAEQSVLIADADERLRTYSADEFRTILDTAIHLIAGYEPTVADHLERQVLRSGFPEALAFVNPRLIYVMPDSCVIYLQKGIGRGIGYHIEVTDSGQASIAWFNEYQSWERTTVDLLQY